MAEAARKAGVATQLGNQGQATEEARVASEIIADGAIGPVREVQVWCPAALLELAALWEGRPPETPPVPEGLDWDLWLGPAPQRPYHPAYYPWTWRNWWDFGTGLLGDLGCHKLSTVFKALKLGHPISVEACSTKLSPETYPLGVMVRFEFPARGEHAARDAHVVRRRLEAAASAGIGARSRHGRRPLHRREGQAHGAPADSRVADEEPTASRRKRCRVRPATTRSG